MPKINSLEVVHQDTNESSYQNLHDILVLLNALLRDDKEVIDASARSSIKILTETYTNDKESFAKLILELEATFGNSLARITEELIVRASEFEAEAKKTTTLIAQVENNYAELQQMFRTAVNQNEALAQSVLDLTSVFNNNTARFTELISTLSLENEARVTDIQFLNASVNSTNASILNEASVRASADNALALEISSMTAGVNVGFDPGISWYFDTTDEGWAGSNSTVAWNNGWIDVESTGTAPSIVSPSGLSIQGSKYNIIKARIKRLAGSAWNGTAYFSTSGHGFSSSYIKTIAAPYPFNVGDTAIIEFDMSSLTVGSTDWITSTITQIKLELGGTATDDISIDWLSIGRNSPGASVASIEEEKIVRASEDAALASSISSLSASVSGNTSAILSEVTARTDADTALSTSISSLSATVDGNTAAISSEVSARADADSALSSDISSISARLDTGDFATVKVTSEANADAIDGLYSRWGVNVDVNGNVAGIQLNSDSSGTSEFKVLADNFKVYKSGTLSDPIFNVGTVNGVSSVGVKGTLLLDNSVGTKGIAVNAVTVPSSFVSTSDVTWITSETEVIGGYITTSGLQPIMINFATGIGGAADGSNYNTNWCGATFYVYIGSNIKTLIGAFSVQPGVMQSTSGVSMYTSAEIAQGTHYIKVTCVPSGVNGTTVLGVQCRRPGITILETKR